MTPASPENSSSKAALIARGAIGGVFMGLANLVPGISGGTMLLAAGVYPDFIQGVSDVTTLRFIKRRSRGFFTLCVIVVAAAASILLFAGVVRDLVVNHRWAMYSLFIGLTLGGVPVLWKLIGYRTNGVWCGALVGLAVMVALAVLQQGGGAAVGSGEQGVVMLFIAGVAGASAMILPGVSGGYLLLLLGCYVPILAGISAFKDHLQARDVSAAMDPALHVLLPVGVGVIVGVVVVSNVIKMLLTRFEKQTLGVLLGLLIGAVVGLWPFHAPVPLDQVSVIKSRAVHVVNDALVYTETGKPVKLNDYPTKMRRPDGAQAAAAAGLIVVGFAVTMLVARIGAGKEDLAL